MVLCLVFIGRKSKSQVPSVSRSLESLEKENDDSKVSEQAHCIFRGRGGEGIGWWDHKHKISTVCQVFLQRVLAFDGVYKIQC